MIAIVVAVAENNVIGKDNQLIWHLPADMRFFKNLTMGHPIVMGRKTYESIGKPLPGRTTVIITRQHDFEAPGCIVVNSIDEAITQAQTIDQDVYIIGGAEIYKQALNKVDTIYLTQVHHAFEGDTFFPEIVESQWEVTSEEKHEPDEKNKYSYSFVTLKRKL
ncbi:dihydrofolate reductase [Pontibacter burrus]|uniref:Dihydrofolate reductase n=1 Tax=Pontibacter burrus TaxID=2704466 RepID=A0A6B3LSV9_9BACT|nr:dihydrofolate reductase [Pontibacter burrus]NEM97316.1 dihydrofolate reductase [Pontibacter burrus]